MNTLPMSSEIKKEPWPSASLSCDCMLDTIIRALKPIFAEAIHISKRCPSK